MSTPETQAPPLDIRSSVKLTRNAKGETQIEVKVRVGDNAEEVAEAQRIAEQVYNTLDGKHR